MRKILFPAVFASCIAATASAGQYTERYASAAQKMQSTCVDFILRKVDDGNLLTQEGFKVRRKTKKKTIYEAKAGLPKAFDVVYNLELAQFKSGGRTCRLMVIRIGRDSANVVYRQTQNDLAKKGGKQVPAKSTPSYTITQHSFGSTIVKVKSTHSGAALLMDYSISRK